MIFKICDFISQFLLRLGIRYAKFLFLVPVPNFWSCFILTSRNANLTTIRFTKRAIIHHRLRTQNFVKILKIHKSNILWILKTGFWDAKGRHRENFTCCDLENLTEFPTLSSGQRVTGMLKMLWNLRTNICLSSSRLVVARTRLYAWATRRKTAEDFTSRLILRWWIEFCGSTGSACWPALNRALLEKTWKMRCQ